MTNEPKLKPCPFCGGTATLFRRFNWNTMCEVCLANPKGHEDKNEAIKAWNTRPKIDVGEIEKIIYKRLFHVDPILRVDISDCAKALAEHFEGKEGI